LHFFRLGADQAEALQREIIPLKHSLRPLRVEDLAILLLLLVVVSVRYYATDRPASRLVVDSAQIFSRFHVDGAGADRPAEGNDNITS
jgi:hypothetical protein